MPLVEPNPEKGCLFAQRYINKYNTLKIIYLQFIKILTNCDTVCKIGGVVMFDSSFVKQAVLRVSPSIFSIVLFHLMIPS